MLQEQSRQDAGDVKVAQMKRQLHFLRTRLDYIIAKMLPEKSHYEATIKVKSEIVEEMSE